jgi:uroporphyrinogen decarboxylase
VLNWGKQKDIREVKQRVGHRMCLMGNVNPLEIAVRGTPEEVREATLDVLEGGGGEGMILSVGGGTSPGMPRENILAMLDALNEFNSKRLAPV